MDKKQVEEFGMMKQAISDIKKTVDKMDSKLDKVIKDKLDKEVFDIYKNNRKSWIQWAPTAITCVIGIIVFIMMI